MRRATDKEGDAVNRNMFLAVLLSLWALCELTGSQLVS